MTVGRETVRRWLREADLVWRRPRPTIRPRDPDRERKLAALRALLRGLPGNETAVFMDEVDVNLNPKVGCQWMRRGEQAAVETPGLVRYNGPATWSLTQDVARLQQFFLARFGRPLPISAMGQTPLHDRMGFDHRNALDVAVHPDSPEGRALMEYLRAAGIPFIAAWGAIPGQTSGAHIHVGQPSPRFSAQR